MQQLPTVTIYQRLQKFYSTTHFRFSKTKFKDITKIITTIYDKKKDNPPCQYVQSIEGENICTVRAYPIGFKRTIDGIIRKKAIEHLLNLKKAEDDFGKKMPKGAPKNNPPKPKFIPRETYVKPEYKPSSTRKRIPIKTTNSTTPQPAYRSRINPNNNG